jgi:uncharacterized protein (DUF433 family)
VRPAPHQAPTASDNPHQIIDLHSPFSWGKGCCVPKKACVQNLTHLQRFGALKESSTDDSSIRGNMNTQFDRITVDPELMNGQPCIRGMRLTVRRVVEAVALYPDRAELKQEYPELEDDDIRQALEFAASSLDDEIIALGAA